MLYNTNRMGTEPIFKILMKMAIPGLISMGVNSLYFLVDRIFIGQGIGAEALAATTISFPIILTIMSYALGISVGASALISRKLGEGKPIEATMIMNNSIGLVCIVSALFTTGSLVFLDNILDFMHTSDEVYPYAKPYIRVILIGAIFQSLSMAFGEFLRAEGQASASMMIMIMGALLNIILDPLVIFVFQWGMAGAAAVTVVSQMAVTIVAFWVIQNKGYHLHINFNQLWPQWSITKSILAIGISAFLTQFAGAVQNSLMNNQIIRYGNETIYGGDIALSAVGTVITITMLFYSLAIGLGFGSRPLIGYNYGAKNYERMKLALIYSSILSGSLLIIGWIIIRLFAPQLISLFTSNSHNGAQLIELGSHVLKVHTLFLPLVCLSFTAINYFQSANKPLLASFSSIFRQIIVLVPLLYLVPHRFGFEGLLYAIPLADLINFVILGLLLWYELQRLNSKSL